ncbi:cupredoxin domain-containing protein [Blastococcus sp. VKM Ac-2987]|uniref:cupredoxin domain-containing protein n=1 Tax=Blastococcus sp. VKM Ac-2987 TaxID=3004141 RepID=UPI0022AB63AC|nr:cupredoxin domain-containing protein [Blastococcus sp. VKM Ac-2987]MCZ2861108.1 cupredoxin domain-containing protein [Blastococcus sp. VKM Ac-2987]
MRSWNARPAALRLAAAITGLALVGTGCGADDDAADAGSAVAAEAETSAEVEPGTETSAPGSSAASTPSTQPSAPSSTQPSAPAGEQGAETVAAQLIDFAIELDEDSYDAGTYEFEVVNAGDASHDLVIELDGADVAATRILQPGQSETLTVTLEPGSYAFYCSVGAHRAMGMEVSVEVA